MKKVLFQPGTIKVIRVVTGCAGGALFAAGSYLYICDDKAVDAYMLCGFASCICLAVSMFLTPIVSMLDRDKADQGDVTDSSRS